MYQTLEQNKQKYNLIKTGQVFCFSIVALNLLWAYFADSALTKLFPLACMGITGITLITVIINKDKKIEKGVFIGYAAFIIWMLLEIVLHGYFVRSSGTLSFLFFNMPPYAIFFIRMFVSVLPCMVFVDYNEFKINKITKVIIFVVLAVSVFYVSRAIAVNPDALRDRVAMENENLGDVLKGTPAYSIVYSYAILFPAFLHKIKVTTQKERLFYIACAIMLIYIIFVAQFATALLLAIVGALLYMFFIAKGRNRLYIILLAVLIGYVIIALDGGADIFRWLSKNIEGRWAKKLEDMAQSLSGQSTGDVALRADRYKMSLEAFYKSPIFGMFINTKSSLGGHSTAIDVLGSGGIIAFIPFVLYMYGNLMRMKNHPSYSVAMPAAIACFVEFVAMAVLKNMITSMAVFFAFSVMVPLLLKSEEAEGNKNAVCKEDNI